MAWRGTQNARVSSQQETREQTAANENRPPIREVSNQTRIKADDYSQLQNPRYATVDETTRNAQAGYSSIERSIEARKQQQKRAAQMEQRGAGVSGQPQRQPTTQKSKNKLALKISDTAIHIKNKVKAMRAAWSVVYPGLWIAAFILLMYLVGMLGLGTAFIGESAFNWLPVFGDDLAELTGKPGQWIFGATWIVNVVVGVTTMLVCAVWFAINRVAWWENGLLVFIFIITLALSIAPLANFVPWFFVFVALVALIYK